MTKYKINQMRARDLAVEWQLRLDSPVQHSWQWCAEWQARFEKIAKKIRLNKRIQRKRHNLTEDSQWEHVI